MVDTHAITLRFEMLYEIEKTVLGSNNLALRVTTSKSNVTVACVYALTYHNSAVNMWGHARENYASVEWLAW